MRYKFLKSLVYDAPLNSFFSFFFHNGCLVSTWKQLLSDLGNCLWKVRLISVFIDGSDSASKQESIGIGLLRRLKSSSSVSDEIC